MGGKGRGGAGQAARKCWQTWAQSAEKYIMLLGFALQTQQDKINLLRIMVAGETYDGVRAAVGKAVQVKVPAVQVKVPDMQELGKLLVVME